MGASLSNNRKSQNNEISTKSRHTIQMQEQTKPKQNKASFFEEPKSLTARVPFNNIQSVIFSVPVCYSERPSKYLERRRGDETGLEQWDFGCVMASVHLAPPTLCSVCCAASASPVGPALILSLGGVPLPPSLPFISRTPAPSLTHTPFCLRFASKPGLNNSHFAFEIFSKRSAKYQIYINILPLRHVNNTVKYSV